MARSTVAVRFTGDTASLKRSLGEIDGKVGGLQSKLAGFGKTAALGLAGAATGLAVLGKSAVDAGSDLNETLSKSNTVFGEQAKAIENWAETGAKAFGQSKQQALEAASSFGNMFSQLGIGDKQAADMSRSMTELASDFASFHNADISEVLSAQQAAFRGEYDAVQRFVPTINAAAVEQKALAMGLKKTSKELTAQDKALATQALLLDGAGDAMGDFSRTSDGLANKQRIMSAQFEDVKAKIGQALIPAVTKLADIFLNRVIPAVQRMVEVVRRNWPEIQETVNDAVEAIRNVVEPIIEGLQALWRNFGDNILSYVKRVWPAIQQVIKGVMNVIQGIIKTVTALIRGDWSQVWEGIKQIVSGVWNAIQGLIRAALEQLRLLIGAGLEVIGSVMKGAWAGIKSTVAGAWSSIKTTVSNAVEAVIGFVASMPGRIARFASTMWNALKDAATRAKEWVVRKVDQMLGPIDEVLGKLNIIGGGGQKAIAGGLRPEDRGLLGNNASGTSSWRGGMTWVGEHGKELVRLPQGTQVFSHARSMAMAGAGGGIVRQPIVLTLNGRVVAEAVAEYDTSQARNNGFT